MRRREASTRPEGNESTRTWRTEQILGVRRSRQTESSDAAGVKHIFVLCKFDLLLNIIHSVYTGRTRTSQQNQQQLSYVCLSDLSTQIIETCSLKREMSLIRQGAHKLFAFSIVYSNTGMLADDGNLPNGSPGRAGESDRQAGRHTPFENPVYLNT